jgi:hypothetical protein
MFNMVSFALSIALTLVARAIAATAATNGTQDQSALMNIWNYQIERKIKMSIKYKEQDLAVWEEVEVAGNTTGNRRYYVTPPATLIPNSAICQHVAITKAYEVVYDIQLWEKDLPSAVVVALKELSLVIREDQIHPLPFYQARIIWNNPEEQLQQLTLSSAWINNLKQQQTYTFRVTAENNASCQLLAETIRTTPNQFSDNIQLQFTVSGAKIDSKTVTVSSEHVAGAQLTASLKNLPGADGPNRYLTSSDYNRFLWQIANQVVATEVISGDYVDADDELSLKNVIAQMFQAQKENSAQFDNNTWNSVFWDPMDARPDLITKELNKFFFYNQTDHLFYKTDSSSSSTSGSASLLKGMFGGSASHGSTSSMTQDDITHLLEQYNIESEFDGQKWVPKKLTLNRLNVNDLNRKDILTTTRIRVRQVEIGGVLQVGVGNASRDKLDDENRYLRQQLADIQNEAKQMKDAFQNEAKQTKDALQSLQSLLDQLQTSSNTLMSEVATLQGQAKNIHIDQCQTIEGHRPANGNDCHIDITCPAGKYLRSAEYDWAYDNFWLKSIVCC